MCPKKVYTLTLHSAGIKDKQFAINPSPPELVQNARMSCTVTYFSALGTSNPDTGDPPALAIFSDMFQPLSWDSHIKAQARALAYVDPVILESKNSSGTLVKRPHYQIGSTGPPQTCVVTSPFGKSVRIQLLQPDGQPLHTFSGASDQSFDPWILKLELEPIMEDKDRMEMMRY